MTRILRQALQQAIARVPIRVMRMIVTLALALLAGVVLKHFYFVPTTEVLRIASLAADDEGYDVFQGGTRLAEMPSIGNKTIPGYKIVALIQDGQQVKSYAIRLATSDVVDLNACKLLRYHNLLSYKRFKGTDKIEVLPEQIGAEVSCSKLDIVPAESPASEHK